MNSRTHQTPAVVHSHCLQMPLFSYALNFCLMFFMEFWAFLIECNCLLRSAKCGGPKTQDAAVHRAETPLEPALNMSSQPELEISHKSAQAGDVTQFRCNPWVCSEGFQRPSPHSRGKDRMKTIWPGEDLQLRLHGLEKIAVPVGHATLVPVKAVNRKILPSKVHSRTVCTKSCKQAGLT